MWGGSFDGSDSHHVQTARCSPRTLNPAKSPATPDLNAPNTTRYTPQTPPPCSPVCVSIRTLTASPAFFWRGNSRRMGSGSFQMGSKSCTSAPPAPCSLRRRGIEPSPAATGWGRGTGASSKRRGGGVGRTLSRFDAKGTDSDSGERRETSSRRRSAQSLYTSVIRNEGHAYAATVWALCLVQVPLSFAPCQTLTVPFASHTLPLRRSYRGAHFCLLE